MNILERTFQTAFAALTNRNFIEAERLFRTFLKSQPKHVGALNLLTIALMSLERFDEAENFIAKAVKLDQKSDVSYYNYGLILKKLNKPKPALEQFNKAIRLNAKVPDTWNNRGTVLNDLKRYQEAISDFDEAIRLKPDYFEALANKSKSLTELLRFEEALSENEKALALQPKSAEAWLGRGNVLFYIQRFEEASAAFDRTIALNPGLAGGWLGRGNVLYEFGRREEALAAYNKALAIAPDTEGAWIGIGNLLHLAERHLDALHAYDKAIAIKPELMQAWLGRGNVFYSLRRFDEAFAAYDKTIELRADSAHAWLGRGNILYDFKHYDEAVAAYDRAFASNPDLPGLRGARFFTRLSLCEWSDFDLHSRDLLASMEFGGTNTPFAFLSIESSAADQLRCAKIWTERRHPPSGEPLWKGEIYRHDRIRIGYLSADFRNHPVSYLMAGVFERHDRTRFETYAISLGPDDSSEMRGRLKGAFDRFVEVSDKSDLDIARQIRALEIDILVDLMGHTKDSRPSILAQRPAPVQVNYLGYPGTMGADYIDYLLADPVLIPPERQHHYSEHVVCLPHSYMPHDRDHRLISDRPLSREEFGLPDKGLVFCCFNQPYKINPGIFRSWMKILEAVDDSVLWLSQPHEAAITNLRAHALTSGIAPERLVFAKRLPSAADHLARQRLADLFLDTLPYNAHTTASDALWAGLPVLTQIGDTFAGRVAASLLKAIELPELIVESREAYEREAIALASDPARLASLKQKLADNRLTTPLFDIRLFTSDLEAAYRSMHERHQAGMPPGPVQLQA